MIGIPATTNNEAKNPKPENIHTNKNNPTKKDAVPPNNISSDQSAARPNINTETQRVIAVIMNVNKLTPFP